MIYKKYLAIIKTEWQRQLTYRVDFYSWRLGGFIEILAQIIVWSIIFKENSIIKGYNYDEIITYVIVGWLFLFLSNNYGLEDKIAGDIYRGSLSNYLTKPITYIKYISLLSLGRISIALTGSILVQFIFIFIFKDNFIFNLNLLAYVIILFILIINYIIRLFISIIIGFLAFWTTEVNGIFYCYRIMYRFFSGAYFPINLLPVIFLNISLLLPFAYSFYFPVQLYLGKISIIDGLKGLGVEIIWMFVLYGIIKIVWKLGLKKNEGVGI